MVVVTSNNEVVVNNKATTGNNKQAMVVNSKHNKVMEVGRDIMWLVYSIWCPQNAITLMGKKIDR